MQVSHHETFLRFAAAQETDKVFRVATVHNSAVLMCRKFPWRSQLGMFVAWFIESCWINISDFMREIRRGIKLINWMNIYQQISLIDIIFPTG